MEKLYLFFLIVMANFQPLNSYATYGAINNSYKKADLEKLITIKQDPASYIIDLNVDNSGDNYLKTLPNELQTVIIEKASTLQKPYIIRIKSALRTLETMKNFDNFLAKTIYSGMLKNRPLLFITKNIETTDATEYNDPNLFSREWHKGMDKSLN